jgi:MFS family permease
MLASITPLGERARRSNWTATTVFYLVGSTAAGAAGGLLAGLLGSLVLGALNAGARLAIVAAALAAGLLLELAHGAVPGPRRQVNEQWLDRYRGWVYGLGFGAQLGAGVTTVVVSSAVYVVWLAALASAHAQTGLVIGAAAGALRGATVLAGARVLTPSALMAFHERMGALERPVRAAGLSAQLALAALAVVAVVV